MDPEMFERLLRECAAHDAFVWLDYMGEALLHPHIGELLQRVEQVGSRSGLESNGTLWDGAIIDALLASRLERLIVTLEPTAALFARHRGNADLEGVVGNLKRFLRRRKGDLPRLELQLILSPHNADHLDDYHRLAASVGADRSFTKPIMIHQFANNDAHYQYIVSRYWSADSPGRYVVGSDGRLALPPRSLSSPCPKCEETVVLSDGTCIMCCYDKEGRWSIGSAEDETLSAVWASGQEFRDTVMRNRGTPICGTCLEGDIEALFDECRSGS